MITANELKHIIPQGETTTVQFKIRSEDAYKMGVEMVAFSNTQGGILVIGVDDKTGIIFGLSFEEIQQTNALLVNAVSENVKPAIVIWVKNGSDKRKVFSNAELRVMMQSCGTLSADSDSVAGSAYTILGHKLSYRIIEN